MTAAGHTISGVRTAYTKDVIGLVQSQINREPRRTAAESADEQEQC